MRSLKSLNQQSPIFKLLIISAVVVGVVILLMRIGTFPHSFWYVLVETLLSINYSLSALEPSEIIEIEYLLSDIFLATITIFFLISCVANLIYFLRTRRNNRQALLPLFINLATVLLIAYANCLVVLPDFYLNLKSRQEVVEMVKSGKFTLGNPRTYEEDKIEHSVYTISLPSKYEHLSRGINKTGEIDIVKGTSDDVKLISFFRSSGLNRGGPKYTAFIYKSEGDSIKEKDIWGVADFTFYLWIFDVEKIKSHWFWVDVLED